MPGGNWLTTFASIETNLSISLLSLPFRWFKQMMVEFNQPLKKHKQAALTSFTNPGVLNLFWKSDLRVLFGRHLFLTHSHLEKGDSMNCMDCLIHFNWELSIFDILSQTHTSQQHYLAREAVFFITLIVWNSSKSDLQGPESVWLTGAVNPPLNFPV